MKTMLYLAMTAQELAQPPHPGRIAYMACHFSPYGPGLTDLPDSLPDDTNVILNDRIPFLRHDCKLIASQLASLPCESILLDLQNMIPEQADELISAILSAVSIPVAVSEQYAADHPCAVFLPAYDADQDPFTSAKKWQGREIWLDLSPGCICYRVRPQGSRRFKEKSPSHIFHHEDDKLLCHYAFEAKEEEAVFFLHRTWEDAHSILDQGKSLGISRGIGLFQEWQMFLPDYGNK